MILGYVDKEVTFSVNFLPSRAGLTTVGFRVLDKNHNELVPRTTASVREVTYLGVPTGVYTVAQTFAAELDGFVVWDSGQSPSAPAATRLRVVTEPLLIASPVVADLGNLGPQLQSDLDGILLAVRVMHDENVMKLPNSPVPDQVRVVRKKPQDSDWSTPYSDNIIPVDRDPNSLRFGGPPL